MVALTNIVRWVREHKKNLVILAYVSWFILGVAWIIYSFTMYPYLSPFVDTEWCAQDFHASISGANYTAVISSDAIPTYFSIYTDPITFGAGFQYSNQFLKEKIVFFQVINETGIFYMKDFPWEKMPSDRIIDYWIHGFKASPKKEVFSVCYRFASGAVLQIILGTQY